MKLGTGQTPYRQVSRMANPTVGLLMPVGHKDKFNASTPDQDHTSKEFMNAIRDPYPVGRIQRALGVQAPPPPRPDLEQGLLWGISKTTGPIKIDLNAHNLNKDVQPGSPVFSDELRLNMSTPVPASSPAMARATGRIDHHMAARPDDQPPVRYHRDPGRPVLVLDQPRQRFRQRPVQASR